MNNLIRHASESITNWISTPYSETEREEGQNFSLPLITLGVIATVGTLYYLSTKVSYIQNGIGHFRCARILASISLNLNSSNITINENFIDYLKGLNENELENISDIIQDLNEDKILTQTNFDELLNNLVNRDLGALEEQNQNILPTNANRIRELHRAGILTQKSFEKVLRNPLFPAVEISRLILQLREADIFVEPKRLDYVVNGPYASLAIDTLRAVLDLHQANIHVTEEWLNKLFSENGRNHINSVNAILRLRAANLNFDQIHPDTLLRNLESITIVVEAILRLHELGILPEGYPNIFFTDDDFGDGYYTAKAILLFNEEGILNQQTLDNFLLYSGQNKREFFYGAEALWGAFTEENLSIILAHAQNAIAIAKGIRMLVQMDIPIEEHLSIILIDGGKRAAFIAEQICRLHRAGILTPEITEIISACNWTDAAGSIVDNMIILKDLELSNQKKFLTICSHPDARFYLIKEIVQFLRSAKISNEEIEKILLENPLECMGTINFAIAVLCKNKICSQENLKALLVNIKERSFSISSFFNRYGWPRKISQKDFDKFIHRVEQEEFGEARKAAVILAMMNRSLPIEQRIPPEIIGHIASFLLPRGLWISQYKYLAEDFAIAIRNRFYPPDFEEDASGETES